MPPQKNAGAKGSKRVTGVENKNSEFIESYIDDVKRSRSTEDVYIARIIRKFGNGRMEAFYLDAEQKPKITQVAIRGSFRYKGKKNVWIEIGSIVLIADSGVSGSAEFAIMATLAQEDLDLIKKYIVLDPRILDVTNVDSQALKSNEKRTDGEFAFEFDNDTVNEEDINVDEI
jgi:hypothetical protein